MNRPEIPRPETPLAFQVDAAPPPDVMRSVPPSPAQDITDAALDALAGRTLPAADAITLGNERREKNATALSQVVWEYPDGTRCRAYLTSGRWRLFTALRGSVGADDLETVLTSDAASAQAHARRYIDAAILLFLCLHPASTWQAPRRIKIGGREITIEPLEANFAAFRDAINLWAEHAIPIHRNDDAHELAARLTDLTWSAAVVSPPGEAAVDAEKKTPSPDSKTTTSASSAPPSE